MSYEKKRGYKVVKATYGTIGVFVREGFVVKSILLKSLLGLDCGDTIIFKNQEDAELICRILNDEQRCKLKSVNTRQER